MHTKQIFLNGSEQYLEPCMVFFGIRVILLPVRLFPPVRLLGFGESSSLYVYSILYDY